MGKPYNSEMNQNEHIRQMTGMRSPSRDDLVEVQNPGAFSSNTAGWPEWAVPWLGIHPGTPCQDHLLRSQNPHPSRPEPSHLWGSSTLHSQNQRTQMAEDRALTTRAWTLPKEKKELEELQDAE